MSSQKYNHIKHKIFEALQADDVALVKELLTLYNQNIADENFESSIFDALSYGTLNSLKILIELGESIESRDSYKNATPIICLASNKYCNLEKLDFLLSLGPNVDAQTRNGTTALMEAASKVRKKKKTLFTIAKTFELPAPISN